MMGVFSELERNIISERVRSGLANARAKGKVVGRPATEYHDIPAIFFKFYPKYKNNEMNKSELARICSLSYPTIFPGNSSPPLKTIFTLFCFESPIT